MDSNDSHLIHVGFVGRRLDLVVLHHHSEKCVWEHHVAVEKQKDSNPCCGPL